MATRISIAMRPMALPGTRAGVPPHALAISLFALFVAALASILWPDSLEQLSALSWLLALVPSFLLAYHRGWSGAAYGLLGAMTLLVVMEIIPGLYLGTRVDWRITGTITVLLIGVSLGAGAVAESLHRERHQALQLAYEDALTGLPNRRVLDFFLARHFGAARRGQPMVVVMFDIDGFKQYNDRYGHQAGDEALRLVGGVLSRNTRLSDVSGRSGGEEFLAVLPGEGSEGATVFAERVREAVERESERAGLRERLTLSAGVAAYDPAMRDASELVEAADRALYAAKKEGKNRTATAGATSSDSGLRHA